MLANEMGVDHWKVSLGYWVLRILVEIGALALRGYGDLVVVAFLGSCFAGVWSGKIMHDQNFKNLILDYPPEDSLEMYAIALAI